MLDLLGELRDQASLQFLLDLTIQANRPSESLLIAAFSALGHFSDKSIASTLLAAYPRKDQAWRSRARELLLSRASWARAYLTAIDQGTLPAGEVSL